MCTYLNRLVHSFVDNVWLVFISSTQGGWKAKLTLVELEPRMQRSKINTTGHFDGCSNDSANLPVYNIVTGPLFSNNTCWDFKGPKRTEHIVLDVTLYRLCHSPPYHFPLPVTRRNHYKTRKLIGCHLSASYPSANPQSWVMCYKHNWMSDDN